MEARRDLRLILAGALLMIVVGGTVDLALDKPASWLSFHVIFELMMIAGALIVTTAMWLGWWHARAEATRLHKSLEERRAERDAWKASAEKALEGFGAAVNHQFDTWHLTPAERDVALLLLKGYSHKHIAKVTSRSERTVRQHAATVYEKAGLASRAELAAFFLEDVMLPSKNTV